MTARCAESGAVGIVGHRIRVSADRTPLLREDEATRQHRITIPTRTRGRVSAVDVAAGTLSVRTDAGGRRWCRLVVLTTQEAAGESRTSPVRARPRRRHDGGDRRGPGMVRQGPDRRATRWSSRGRSSAAPAATRRSTTLASERTRSAG